MDACLARPIASRRPPVAATAVPFGDVLYRYVLRARRGLYARVGEARVRLAQPATRAFERKLLGELSEIAAPVLLAEFDAYRRATSRPTARPATVPGAWTPALGTPTSAPGREQYAHFTAGLRGAAWCALLARYPALPGLLRLLVRRWVDATAEFVERLAQDAPALHAAFGTPTSGRVRSVACGMSDPHRGGRVVVVAEFDNAVRVVYKPRGLAADVAYHDLLDWLEADGADLAELQRVATLDRGSHGWCAFVEAAECPVVDVPQYYRAAGSLLAVTYLLGSSDLHHENVIAAGRSPVLVDLETVVQARVRASGDARWGEHAARRWLYEDSVLRTGLLPVWLPCAGGRAIDVGGLSAVGGQETPFACVRWEHVNTDAMRSVRHTAVVAEQCNRPSVAGGAHELGTYLEPLLDGFATTYRALVERRGALTAPNGPLARFAPVFVRFVLRPSNVYAVLLRRSVEPRCLVSPAARAAVLRGLERAFDAQPEHPGVPLLAHERACLEALDIPAFHARGDALAVTPARGLTVPVFAASAHACVLERLAAMGERDLARQAHVIRAAVALRSPALPARAAQAERPQTGPHGAVGLGAASLSAARDVIDRLAEALCLTTDDTPGPSWLSADPTAPGSWQHCLTMTDAGLYDGAAGIALFLSHAAAVTGDARARALLDVALRPLERLVGARDGAVAPPGAAGGIGGSGIGGMLYAAACTARALDDDRAAALGAALAACVGPTAVAQDRAFDVMSGSAGAVLGLLRLHAVCPADVLIDRALVCGFHLLNARRPVGPRGERAWLTANGRPCCGFAHGASGIALALARLYEVSGDPAFRAAAIEAIAFEDAVHAVYGYWPDLRGALPGSLLAGLGLPGPTQDASVPHARSWCYGPSGAALARAEIRRALGGGPWTAGEDAGLADTLATLAGEPLPVDSLCCGSAGLVDVAIELSRHEGAYAPAASAAGRALVASPDASRRWRCLPGVDPLFVPGLYRGASGMGYLALRLAAPDRVPCALSWN